MIWIKIIGVKITATGNAGHGSAMLQGTAIERLLQSLEMVQEFRSEQMARLVKSDNQLRDCGRLTSVNITMLEAGKQVNVIPDEAIARIEEYTERLSIAICRFGCSGC